jgi:serine/threonine protein kinase/dipeptidyl aminopeptidase/acylaminoacyl peptidase
LIGKRISHYSVTAKLGEGGMGEVYLATDSRLGRNVALKVLPEVFASDAERMARFEREAQLLASLNHPNIATIHGLEEADGVRCLVLELVEGPTLAERIAKGPIPFDEALPIARQVAEALEAAHERGVIHRDLKPGNIKVTPEGTVKVLDFGLAKAFQGEEREEDIAKSPTMTAMATQAGIILGTAAYMSPEQAKGKPVDQRGDVWAFGVVLFEMLTGKQLYSGETVSETLASVIKDKPTWEALPSDTPAPVRKLLRRCLEREPRQRLQAVGEARILIDRVLTGAPEDETPAVMAPLPVQNGKVKLAWAAGALVVALVAGGTAWNLKPTPKRPLQKFELPAADILGGDTLKNPLALSPDGRKVAYVSGGHLWLRELDQLEPRQVPGSENAEIPFWSPDSAFVGYAASGKLWKSPVSGTESTAICDMEGGLIGGAGGSWTPDGRIIFARGGTGLLEVSARGGDLRPLLELDTETEGDLHQPHALPDGRGVLYIIHRKGGRPDTLALLTGKDKKVLLQLEGQTLGEPVYSPTGHILYQRNPANAGVWALPFSLPKLKVTGEPFLVAPNGDYPSASAEGTLAYVQGSGTRLTQLAWVNRSGQVLGPIGRPQQQDPFPALSPDGRRVAIEVRENEGEDIWIHDAVRGTMTRLTFDPAPENRPAWSPTGDRIVYHLGSDRNNLTLAIKPADGTGQAQTLVKGLEPSFTPDGKGVVYTGVAEDDSLDLWYLPLEGEKKPRLVVSDPNDQEWPRVSPDGRYVAYVSYESGDAEVYLKPFPSGEGKWQVSVNGGNWPHWSRRGDKLYYVEGNDLMEVDVSTRASLTLGTPQRLFTRQGSGVPLPFGWPDGFDVAPDGDRFVLLQGADRDSNAGPAGITMVQNWFAEFKDKN